jgi:predicted KAP-like P-loop ATPase
LTRAFFQHLYAGLGKEVSNEAQQLILSLGKKLSAPTVGAVANFFTLGLGGSLAERLTEVVADQIKTEKTVEHEYEKLSEELQKQEKRFLVIIDDIDRLTPDHSLLIFRLIKSVGRLPKVIYLLAFDRKVADRVLADRFPSDRQFLEKIVQAIFEVPPPDAEVLHKALLNQLLELTDHPADDEGVRFRNVLIDVVNPLIKLPRDLARYMGTVNVALGAVGDEVNLTDLMAIEALRLFQFPLHQTLRAHPEMVCGTGGGSRSQKNQSAEYDEIFLSSAKTDQEKNFLRTALKRLFPRLESVWGNMHYNSSSELAWRGQRRICHPRYFSSYFRLSLGGDVFPRKALNPLISKCDDTKFVQDFFRERMQTIRKDGRSEAPLVLDDLTAAPELIPPEKLLPFLKALFEIADEIDSEVDEERGFGSHGSNGLRMHWLLNSLVRDRLPQNERSDLFRKALESASLGWTIDLTRRFYAEHWPRESQSKTSPEQCLVDEKTASDLASRTVDRIQKAAQSGELLKLRHFTQGLFRWGEFAGTYDEVKRWTDERLADDNFVIGMADAASGTAWVSSMGFGDMGDRVSKGVPTANVEGFKTILDTDRLLARISEIEQKLPEGDDKKIIERFREGMRREEEEHGHRRPAASPDDDSQQSGGDNRPDSVQNDK